MEDINNEELFRLQNTVVETGKGTEDYYLALKEVARILTQNRLKTLGVFYEKCKIDELSHNVAVYIILRLLEKGKAIKPPSVIAVVRYTVLHFLHYKDFHDTNSSPIEESLEARVDIEGDYFMKEKIKDILRKKYYHEEEEEELRKEVEGRLNEKI